MWGWLKRFAGRVRKSVFVPLKQKLEIFIERGKRGLSDYCHNVLAFVKEHPWLFRVSLCLVVTGLLLIIVPIAIGFAPGGVVAGSIAAGWHSVIGNIIAGSWFAILQSLSMLGIFIGVGFALVAVGVAIPLLGGLWRWYQGGPSDDKEE